MSESGLNWEKYRVEEPKPPTEITTVGLEKLPSGRELLPSNIIAFVAPGYFIVGVKRPQSAQNRPQIDLEGQKRYIFVFKKLSSASLFSVQKQRRRFISCRLLLLLLYDCFVTGWNSDHSYPSCLLPSYRQSIKSKGPIKVLNFKNTVYPSSKKLFSCATCQDVDIEPTVWKISSNLFNLINWAKSTEKQSQFNQIKLSLSSLPPADLLPYIANVK